MKTKLILSINMSLCLLIHRVSNSMSDVEPELLGNFLPKSIIYKNGTIDPIVWHRYPVIMV